MNVTITVEATLTTITCGVCGGVYALSEIYRQKKYEKGGFWHCPYCQNSWGYPEDGSENEQLKRQLKECDGALASERARHDQTRACLTAQKAQTSKYRNKAQRTAKGVCPHCNRYFSNLHAHMTSKHSEREW